MTAAGFAAAGRIYSANCVSCHGAGGRGDGPAAGALKPSSVNFHVSQLSRGTQIAENALEGPDAVLKSRNSGRVCIQIADRVGFGTDET